MSKQQQHQPPISEEDVCIYKCPRNFSHIEYLCDSIGMTSNITEFLWKAHENMIYDHINHKGESCLYWIEYYMKEKIKLINLNWSLYDRFRFLGFNDMYSNALEGWYAKRYFTIEKHKKYAQQRHKQNDNLDSMERWIVWYIRLQIKGRLWDVWGDVPLGMYKFCK